jgi:hypothetical protein
MLKKECAKQHASFTEVKKRERKMGRVDAALREEPVG